MKRLFGRVDEFQRLLVLLAAGMLGWLLLALSLSAQCARQQEAHWNCRVYEERAATYLTCRGAAATPTPSVFSTDHK